MRRTLSTILVILFVGAVSLVLAQGRSQGSREAWDTDEMVTLDGVLTEVERPYATLVSEGTSYVVHLGPPWYWAKSGFEVHSGDEVSIHGQVSREGDEIHLYPHSIARGDQALRLADEDGVPVWSGRGSAERTPPPDAARPGRGGRGCCGGWVGAGCGRARHGRGARWNG